MSAVGMPGPGGQQLLQRARVQHRHHVQLGAQDLRFQIALAGQRPIGQQQEVLGPGGRRPQQVVQDQPQIGVARAKPDEHEAALGVQPPQEAGHRLHPRAAAQVGRRQAQGIRVGEAAQRLQQERADAVLHPVALGQHARVQPPAPAVLQGLLPALGQAAGDHPPPGQARRQGDRLGRLARPAGNVPQRLPPGLPGQPLPQPGDRGGVLPPIDQVQDGPGMLAPVDMVVPRSPASREAFRQPPQQRLPPPGRLGLQEAEPGDEHALSGADALGEGRRDRHGGFRSSVVARLSTDAQSKPVANREANTGKPKNSEAKRQRSQKKMRRRPRLRLRT